MFVLKLLPRAWTVIFAEYHFSKDEKYDTLQTVLFEGHGLLLTIPFFRATETEGSLHGRRGYLLVALSY